MRWLRQANSLKPGRGVCVLCALALIVLLFGDVLFLRASLAPIDYAEVLASTQAPRTVSWFPERAGRTILHGQGDTGAAAYQLQPAARFMAFCMRHRQSPYWDPYTATGALGPEALVDLKFSPLILITAIFGGSSKAFTFVLVAIYFCAAYCLLRALTAHVGFTLLPAFAAAALFFLNGFALNNLYTQMGQPYFLAPLVLLALLVVTERPRPATFALAVGANLLLFGTTFFPILVLVAIVVYGFTLSFRIAENPERWRTILLLHASMPLAAVAVLGFLYVPIFAAYFSYLDTVAQYAQRRTPGVSWINLLSLFTPKHIWESYRATRMPAVPPGDAYDPWLQHMGIVGPILAIHAFSGMTRRTVAPIGSLAICAAAAFGQIFGIFPFTLLDSLPFFSFVQNVYWSAMLMLALVLLVPYGLAAIRASRSFTLPCATLIGVIVCSFVVMDRHVNRLRAGAMPPVHAAGNAITLSIDIPAVQGPDLSGGLQFGGWAVATDAPISRVDIAVDGKFVEDAGYGGTRDDVCHVYPGRPGCPKVGWNAPLDTTQLSNGTHTVSVTAYTSTGHITQERRFRVSNPWAPPYLAVFWTVLGGISVILLAGRRAGWARYSALSAVGLLVCEGVFYMNNLRPYRSNRDENLTPVIAWIKKTIDEQPGSRILDIGRTGVFPNWGSGLQIPQLGNLNSGEFPWYRDFFHQSIGSGLFLSLDSTDSALRFTGESLSFVGVRYVIVEKTMSNAITKLSSMGYPVVQQDSIREIFENPHPKPRAFIARDSTVSSEPVQIFDYSHDTIRLQCTLREPGSLILTDSWNPGWKAEVDGKQIRIEKADVAFRGLPLSKGTHLIVFRYKPWAIVVGMVLTAASVSLLGAVWILLELSGPRRRISAR
ncbi:MAG: YfhO family protein [Acidobacteriaceae bacterium]|nr:YfhO family protein [Acidobacteriaceae bacterium]